MSRLNLTRENYDYWYHQLREEGVELRDVYAAHYNPNIAPSKALRSFEHRDDNFEGWVNRDLWSKFIDRRMALDGWIEAQAS